ncbi:winged helix DNA-binding protein [Elizabethkingia anophelis]|nr:winged helix DNA-binding protein [Elizabethkingia anophelis]MCT3659005.1 winged helix DNA-binding protein [Elizabethkingia anophelis]MCT3666170.1 winged helix DNA-binding protein [Elizabethkingia anophelis]MCT3852199.1 winged helix DNA-binding protein [Elizabethkingia anophelis]MCT3863016.1 winged helix DNA-binding protein [Elizabethkingia anophelis]
MNKTAEIVNRWAAFEAEHPKASIHDFFRYELIREREEQKNVKFLGGVIPPEPNQILPKIMDRITKISMVYITDLLKSIDIGTFDEFLYLNNIQHLEKPRKIDVINNNFNELSSGLLILERLKKKGLLTENADPNDKRSKLLALTPKGLKKLKACYELLGKVNQVIFRDMQEDDILLCIQLLKPIETKFSSLTITDKKLSFDEVYKRELSGK